MKKFYTLAASVGILFFSRAQVSDLGSYVQVTDISNTGIAVGNVYGMAIFMWSKANSGTVIGEAGDTGVSGNANITADGSVISMALPNPDNQGISEALLYTVADGSIQYRGNLGTVSDGDTSSPWGMSSNGQNVAGFSWTGTSKGEAVLWKNGGTITSLGSTVNGRSSRGNDVSADGSVVVGWQDAANGVRQGAIWKNGVQQLLRDNDGAILGEAVSVSADGKTVAGVTLGTGKGYVWNETEGTVFITSNNPDYITEMTAMSDDGNTVLGFSFDPVQSILLGEGFIWTRENGKILLNEYVSSLGYDDLNIVFSVPTGISPDGKFIGGIGVNFTESDAKGFVIQFPGSTLATAQPKKQATVTLFPNPVKDIASFQSTEPVLTAQIYSADGRAVTVKNIVSNKMDVSDLKTGMYVVKVTTATSAQTLRLIKE